MLRSRLLTATAAVALFAAGSAFAQDMPVQPAPAPAEMPTSMPAPAQDATPAEAATVVEVLRADGQFTTLLAALDAAQLTETLTTQSAISIFAPTDAAFAALPEADRTRLLDPANVNELRQVLLYHVVVADVESSQIEGARGGVQTAANTEVQLDGTGSAIKVDAATVTTADIRAGNGAVFIIDRVLNPAESLVASGDAEEAAPAADDAATPPADVTSPPIDEALDDATPPADSTTPDAMDADSAMDDGAMPPPPTAPASATPSTAPATSPSTATIASPIVPNPTDGQVDGDDDDDGVTTPPAPEA